jgi:DNA polymerase III subunit delta'
VSSAGSSPAAIAPLPWHGDPLERIRAAWSSGRLPHALLLHGPQGLGKVAFAHWLAAAVLCDAPLAPLDACGTCAGCRLLQAASHPDFTTVKVAQDKSAISVEQIRDTCERLAMTSYRCGAKVAVIEEAHRMTVNAANSLLKTLEEPPPNSLLVVVTSRPGALPATVRSRCQRLAFRAPPRSVAREWLEQQTGAAVADAVLEYSAGAPLAALAAAGPFAELDGRMRRALADLAEGRADIASVAAAWARDQLDERLGWLDFWLSRGIRLHISGIADHVTQSQGATLLPSSLPALNITSLYGTLDRVRELRRTLARTALQKELAVEMVLGDLLRSVVLPARR